MAKRTARQVKLSYRTIKLIERGMKIVLKRNEPMHGKSDWYLHCHTNIAGGPDKAEWGKVDCALEIDNLEWAFTIAKLYNCSVQAVRVKIDYDVELQSP